MIELLKVVTQTTAVIRDEKGVIVGEQVFEPITLYAPDLNGLHRKIRAELARLNEAS